MKLRSLLAGTTFALLSALPLTAAAACPALLDHRMLRLQDEKPVDLCRYSGQVVLVVNTASFCGYTPQYKSLEALHSRLQSRGLVVLGFPSNDFGQQEPGSNAAIADFCESTYGVKFPMFVKSQVTPKGGADLNPLYTQLIAQTGKAPRWNFHKYLIGRDGKTLSSWGSSVTPDDPALIAAIERQLAAKPD